ncbi:hypothetical protein HNQ39_000568 [Armatimonas rosea]|uniref:Uncharacterized protein n=1 Tax=Armatimonas rosea TaxID=685828 RepID=A0A7W9SLF0_ARMRO|nr:hypothetical protein [Armatimonas rosea]
MWQLMLIGGAGGGLGAVGIGYLFPKYILYSALSLVFLVILLTFSMMLICSFEKEK